MELGKDDMELVTGGSSVGIIAGVVSVIIFIIGIFSGYAEPNSCNN